MDWTLEYNMVDGLFSCATVTGQKGHIPSLPAEAETSNTGADAVKPDPRCPCHSQVRIQPVSIRGKISVTFGSQIS